jgi:hypothetical protein
MLNPALLFQHSAIYGAILSVLMLFLFIGIAYLNPEIWLKDYPPDIQDKFGSISKKAKQQRRLVAIPVFLILFGIIILSIVQLRQISGGELTFLDIFLSTFVILQTFNVVDLLILDWLIFVTVRPSVIILPGTEGLQGYSDYGFHFRAFLKGVVGGLIVSLIVAGITSMLEILVLPYPPALVMQPLL